MNDPFVLLHRLQQLLGDPDIWVGDAEVPFEIGDVDRSATFLRASDIHARVRGNIGGERWRDTNLECISDDDRTRKDVPPKRGEFAESHCWTVCTYIKNGMSDMLASDRIHIVCRKVAWRESSLMRVWCKCDDPSLLDTSHCKPSHPFSFSLAVCITTIDRNHSSHTASTHQRPEPQP